MSDLQARLVAAIQQVRQQVQHTEDCHWAMQGPSAPPGCICNREGRVDARLAACVEAYGRGGMWCAVTHRHGFDDESGLAAFLAAAAQEETQK
jgi:hypothetical protein